MSLRDVTTGNALMGQFALPTPEMRFDQPRIQQAHALLLEHFAGLSPAAQQENRRNVTYASVVNAGSTYAFAERFNYHGTAIPAAELQAEVDLMARMGMSAAGLQCLRNATDGEEAPYLWLNVGELDGRFRTSVYGQPHTLARAGRGVAEAEVKHLEATLDASLYPIEVFVGWGLDFVNGALAGAKMYSYIHSSFLNEFKEMLAKEWDVQIPDQIWALNQRFGFARRYEMSGALSSVKLILGNVNSDIQPAAALAEVIQPVMIDVSSDSFDLPWDRIRLRAFNLDYAPTGEFLKCIAYYCFPARPGA